MHTDNKISELSVEELRKQVEELHIKNYELMVQNKELEYSRRKLKNDLERYHQIFDSTSDSILVANDDLEYIEVNSAACDLLGFSKAEFKGMTIKDITPPEFWDEVDLAWEEFQKMGSQRSEYAVLKKDGSQIQVEYQATANFIPGLHVSILRDISQRKKLERDLDNRIRQNQSFIQDSPVGIWKIVFKTPLQLELPEAEIEKTIIGEDKIIECNDALAQMYGFQNNEELLNSPVLGHIYNWENTLERVIVDLRNGLKTEAIEQCKSDKNGNPRFFRESYFSEIEDGRLQSLWGIQIDISEQKRFEKELIEAERRYRDIFENATEGIFQTTAEGKYLMGNSALANIYGYESFEELQKSINDAEKQLFVRPGRRKELVKSLQENGEVKNFESEMRHKDGGLIWISENVRAVKDDSGGIKYLEGTIQDITRTRKAKSELEQQKELLQTVLDNIPIMIALLDEKGKFKWVNRFYEQRLGWSLNEAQTKDILKEYYPDPDYYEYVLKYIQNPPGGWADFKTRIRDGTVLDTSWTNMILSDGSSIGIGQDISQRKKNEEKLRNTSNLLQKILEGLKEAVFVVNFHSRKIDFCNHSVKDIFGYSPEEVIGQTTEFLYINKAQFEKFGRRVRRALKSKSFVEAEFDLKTKKGKIVRASIISKKLDEENLQDEGFVSIIRDITRERNYLTQIQKSRRQLRKLAAHLQDIREEERKNLAREIHDELGQMLTVIKMDLTMLKRDLGHAREISELPLLLNDIDETRELLDKTIKQMRRMVTDLRPVILDSYSLKDALRWQIDEFEKYSSITCIYHTNIKTLKISDQIGVALFRILQEALTNVSRHSNASRVEVRFEQMNGSIKLVVKDNGNGIRSYMNNSTKSLGIVSMRERMIAIGGSLKINGKPHQGTVVEADVPLN